MAATAIMGLVRRLESGRGSMVQVSLARTERLLVTHAAEPGNPSFRLPDAGATLTEDVYGLGSGPTRRLAHPVVVDGSPLFWDRPAELSGSSSATWGGPARDED